MRCLFYNVCRIKKAGVVRLSSDWNNLDLVDILGERHLQLQKVTETSWDDNSNVKLSNSEWFILARIYNKQPTIAHVAKNVDISRQATHKLIKNLAEKGLVKISNSTQNKRAKNIQLTELGDACYEKKQALKADLESKVAENIGFDQLQTIKDILKKDWGI